MSSLTRLFIRTANQPLFVLRNKPIEYSGNRLFSVSSKKNAIPPLFWLIVKPISKLSSMLVGRGVRKWWAQLPKAKQTIFKEHLIRNKYRYGGVISSTALTSVIYYQVNVQEVPITHRKRFIIFNSKQLKDVEDLEKEEFIASYKKQILNNSSPKTKRALSIAKRLFAANREIPEVEDINWRLTVIDDNQCQNAVAFPSGDVVLFTGLMDITENDDELACILAHEMSHAILQHAAEEVSHDRLIDIFSITLSGILWAILPNDITALFSEYFASRLLKFMLQLPYSRELESEADTVGLMLAARACFDVRCAVTFWERMDKHDDEDQKIPEYLSTHPANQARAVDLEMLLPQALQLRIECKCHRLT